MDVSKFSKSQMVIMVAATAAALITLASMLVWQFPPYVPQFGVLVMCAIIITTTVLEQAGKRR